MRHKGVRHSHGRAERSAPPARDRRGAAPSAPPPPVEPSGAIAAACEAAARVGALLGDAATDAYRILWGARIGLDGLIVDRYGVVLVAQLHEGRFRSDEALARRVCASLLESTGAAAVYRKVFPRERSAALAALAAAHNDPTPWIGSSVPSEIPIVEQGVRFLIRPYDGYATGLFLEQRGNRARIRAAAAGRRVLNLFAYTCGFGVVAALGGATETTNVDVSKRCLEWGKRNFEANGVDCGGQRFFASDVFEFFGRARRQGRRYDLAIIDPPTFARVKGASRPFVLREQLDALVSQTLELLDPGGELLLCTNQRDLGHAALERAVRSAAGGRRVAIAPRTPLPPDFADDPEFSKSVFARCE